MRDTGGMPLWMCKVDTPRVLGTLSVGWRVLRRRHCLLWCNFRHALYSNPNCNPNCIRHHACSLSITDLSSKRKVYVGEPGLSDVMKPPIAAAEASTSMADLLDQPCFAAPDESQMFLSFNDGDIVGGRFPSFAEDRPLHRGWSNAEYFRVTEGSSYIVGTQPGRGTVQMNLAMAKSSVVKAELQVQPPCYLAYLTAGLAGCPGCSK